MLCNLVNNLEVPRQLMRTYYVSHILIVDPGAWRQEKGMHTWTLRRAIMAATAAAEAFSVSFSACVTMSSWLRGPSC